MRLPRRRPVWSLRRVCRRPRMKSSLDSKRISRLGLILMLSAGSLSSTASFAADNEKPSSEAPTNKSEPMLSAEDFRKQEEWRNSIALVPQPKKGCFTAKFPSKEWQEIPCVPGPDYPMPPRSFAADNEKPSSEAATNKSEPMLSAEDFRKQEEWRNSIALVPQPKKGCFTAKFPSKEWQEIPCVPGPDYPMPPRS